MEAFGIGGIKLKFEDLPIIVLERLVQNLPLLQLEVKTQMMSGSADIHTMTASKIWDIGIQEVTPKQRELAKLYNYGRLYNMSDEGLMQMLRGFYGR